MQSEMQTGQQVFVDVLTLRPTRTVAEAIAYFGQVGPIAARHGLHIIKALEVDKKMRGHDAVNPNMVQLWRVERETAFAGLGGDPDYQAMIPARDALFDMPNLQGWFGTVK